MIIYVYPINYYKINRVIYFVNFVLLTKYIMLIQKIFECISSNNI